MNSKEYSAIRDTCRFISKGMLMPNVVKWMASLQVVTLDGTSIVVKMVISDPSSVIIVVSNISTF